MQKPVWRLNTGNGVPSDLGLEIIYRDNEIRQTAGRMIKASLLGWRLDGDDCDIYAYETTRTRTAKRGVK